MLTPAQNAIIKAYIEADAILMAFPHNSDGAYAVADAINTVAAPNYIVWRGVMPVEEIEQNGFAWNQLDTVPAAKYRIWERLTASGYINPTKANVRQGINDFCKDGSNNTITALRNSILPHLKRQASIVEKLLATGAGTDASPSTMGFEGPISYNDVQNLMGW